MSSPVASATAVALPYDPDDLRVARIRALRGPNYWRLSPVIGCDVQLGSLEDASTTDIPEFNQRLTTALPSLVDRAWGDDGIATFGDRLREGTTIPHVIEHVALELQTLAGSDATFGCVVPSGDQSVWWVMVAYDEEDVGIASVRDAVRIARACISGEPLDVDVLVRQLQALYEEVRLGPSTAAIVEEARRRSIPVRRLNSRSLIQLGHGRNLRRIQATMTDLTSSIAVEIAQDKEDTKRVLSNIGLPVPRGDVAYSLEDAISIAEEIGFPVILKPIDGSHGRGISGLLSDADGVREAWSVTREESSRVIVEHFHAGRDHRVLVVNGKVVAAAERVPAHVDGDGKRTIRQLIDDANCDPRRGVGHTKILTRLPADERTETYIAQRGLTLDSVPGAGERVFLRGTANLSTGGTSIDRTDEMHPDNVTACEMAAGIVGLDIAGIDIMTPDLSVPFRQNDAVIVEVNAAPGIRMHTHPTEGTPRNVGAPILDMLYPPGAEPTIPIIAVTGTNGKTTTVRLIAHLFRNTGRLVGFTTTDGVYIQNRMVMEGDMTGPFAANIILSHPTIDVAVLETARGGILRAGLGFEECDVGVVLNVSEDHLGLRGINTIEQLADVKSTIARVVKREGHAVLNADDPLVCAMREKTPGDVVLFSASEKGENLVLEDHVARGGIAACLQDGSFVISRGRLRIPIASEREVPLMIGGAARFQRQNILAAIASAYVQGMRYDDIRAGLLSFFPSPSLTPGRLNIIRLRNGARVIVDYAHNPAAIEGLLEFVLQLPAARRIGVITVPGDRRDHDIAEAGRLSARLDHVIVKEDSDRRGREPGEIAGLLTRGLCEGGLDTTRIETVYDEAEALRRTIPRLAEDDILVVYAEKVSRTLAVVREHAERSA